MTKAEEKIDNGIVEEGVSYPNRGNKPLQERVVALGQEVGALKETVSQLIETIRSGQMAGAGDQTSLVWKLYQEEKKARVEMFDKLLKSLEEKASETSSSTGASLENLLAIAQDETTGPLVQRLLGKEPDWERLIDKVFDRLSPPPGGVVAGRPAAARPVAAPEATVEVVK